MIDKRVYLKIAILAVLAATIAFLGLRIYALRSDVASGTAERTTAPSQLMATDTAGVERTLSLHHAGDSLMLVLFSPECGDCYDQARELLAAGPTLRGYRVIFLSEFPAASVNNYRLEVARMGNNNFEYYSLPAGALLRQFATAVTPTILAYDGRGDLIGMFQGGVTAATTLSTALFTR